MTQERYYASTNSLKCCAYRLSNLYLQMGLKRKKMGHVKFLKITYLTVLILMIVFMSRSRTTFSSYPSSLHLQYGLRVTITIGR